MYSNFITPPNFVHEDKHTVTVIDATVEDVETLAAVAQNSNEDFNVYLYRNEMENLDWLHQALDLSDSVIINIDNFDWLNLCNNNRVYYYGEKTLLSPATKINNPVEYFILRKKCR